MIHEVPDLPRPTQPPTAIAELADHSRPRLFPEVTEVGRAPRITPEIPGPTQPDRQFSPEGPRSEEATLLPRTTPVEHYRSEDSLQSPRGGLVPTPPGITTEPNLPQRADSTPNFTVRETSEPFFDYSRIHVRGHKATLDDFL